MAQKDDGKNDREMYYLSKRLHDYETRYIPKKKSFFALMRVIQELKHVILPFQVWIIAKMDPLKYLFEKPTLCRRLSMVNLVRQVRSIVCG